MLFATAVLVGAWRMQGRPVWTRPEGARVAAVGAALLLTLSVSALVGVYRAREMPPGPAALTFPLRGGAPHIVSGGSHPLMNPHMKVAALQLHAWRGQMWGLDFVELYFWAVGLKVCTPAAFDRYAIFGASVYAPCSGWGAVENNLPDLIPPASDTTKQSWKLRDPSV